MSRRGHARAGRNDGGRVDSVVGRRLALLDVVGEHFKEIPPEDDGNPA